MKRSLKNVIYSLQFFGRIDFKAKVHRSVRPMTSGGPEIYRGFPNSPVGEIVSNATWVAIEEP